MLAGLWLFLLLLLFVLNLVKLCVIVRSNLHGSYGLPDLCFVSVRLHVILISFPLKKLSAYSLCS